MPHETPKLPFRERKYRDLKEAFRKAVWSHPEGQGHIAVDAGMDPSVLSRWLSEDPNETAGKWVNRLIPLLVALGDRGIEVYDYIGEELRAAQERGREDDEAAANRIIKEYGPAVFEALKIKAQGSAKK